MSFLELERLEKTFPDGTIAVKGIDLSIEEGQFIVLLGPSGCGKTTTLRMVAGLEAPSRGVIRLAGREVTDLRPSQRDVGFVFQFYALYPHLSVAENVAFPLECAGVAPRERDRAVARIAERLGITRLLPRRPRELAGGDQQRVALARAMVRKPAIWLMDEPLGTLDSERRLELAELIRAQQLEQRVTTLYVTHDQDEAMRLADRVVVMSAGKILQDDAPSRVYDHPADLFVANFVGSPGMNIFAGDVVPGVAGASFRPRGTDLEIVLGRAARPGPVLLGIRPEFVRIDPAGPIRSRLAVDEYLGASHVLHLDGPLGRLVLRASPEALPQGLRAGDELRVALVAEHLRLFDATSRESRA